MLPQPPQHIRHGQAQELTDLAIAVERFLYLTRIGRGNDRLWGDLQPLFEAEVFGKSDPDRGIGAGLIPLVAPRWTQHMSHSLHPLLESGILLTSFAAVLLNMFFNGGRAQEQLKESIRKTQSEIRAADKKLDSMRATSGRPSIQQLAS